MTAEEIRKWDRLFDKKEITAETARARARIEIAAQLAELNATLRAITRTEHGYGRLIACVDGNIEVHSD